MSQYITGRLVFSSARKVQVNWPPSGGLVFVTESGCYSQDKMDGGQQDAGNIYSGGHPPLLAEASLAKISK